MRLLVVEDDVKIAAPRERGLEREGCAVDVAATGKEGADGYLREKVDRPFGRRTIETVRGTGHHLRPHGG